MLGDVLDYYSVSNYAKDPGIDAMLKREIEEGRKFLQKIRDNFPKQVIKYLEGNHEHRLQKFIHKNSPALSGLLHTQDLLELKKNNILWYAYGPNQICSVLGLHDLGARHEPYSHSVNYLRQTAIGIHRSLLFGHTHSMAALSTVNKMGKRIRVFSCGHLADIKHPCFNYYKSAKPWEIGFAVVFKTKKDWFVNQVTITENYEAVFNGKTFRG